MSVPEVRAAAPAESPGPKGHRRFPVWAWIACGAVAATLAVTGAVGIPSMIHEAKSQAFLKTLRADPNSSVDGLSDEQLLVSFDLNCRDIARGRTVEHEMRDAERNWEATKGYGPLTEFEYYDNVRALFEAASAHC
ncbi:hypothetical protein [Microbacterium sp. 69-10]|uniref:hypothetical protein n=1 Tax=Microbacterium sp. 69-10 TaxID=1895783 RepID=UPI0025F015E7|nr:hypothetical protein [Microbacterium sp. 69-10]